jgi:cytidine deaminase
LTDQKALYMMYLYKLNKKEIKMKTIKFKDLTTEQKKLLKAAEKAMDTAYNPYSKFFVGAALLTRDNKIITGSNVENAAYGSTICAERAAILRANALGKRCFKSMALIAKGEDFDTKEVTAPCGACRQVLLEFSQISETDLSIIMSTTKKDKIVIASISELLPLNFGPKDIGIDIKHYQK